MMFCSRCGQKVVGKIKFCPNCGAPVETDEQEPAPEEPRASFATVSEQASEEPAPEEPASEEPAKAQDAAEETRSEAVTESPEEMPVKEESPVSAANQPAEEKKPILTGKKGGRSLAIIAALAVLAVMLVIGLAKLIPALFGGDKEAYVYSTDNGELMFRKDLREKTEPVELSDDSAEFVRFSKDGKYIYFFESRASGFYAELYRIRTADAGKKNASPEKIASDVSMDSLTVLDAGGLVYCKGDANNSDLYYYNGKESSRLVKDVSSYTLDEGQNYIYCREMDNSDGTLSLYRVNFRKNGDKETLLKDVDIIYGDYDAEVLVYGMSAGDGTYDVYTQKLGDDKQKVASEVYEVKDVSVSRGSAQVLYLTKEGETASLYDFVTDNYAASDSSARMPDRADYQTYVQSFWSGYYTTDWEAYNRAMEQWRPIEQRNNIRNVLKDESYSMEYYTLSLSNGEDTKKIAEKVTSLCCDLDASIYLYQKYEGKVEAVADLSELDSVWDIYNYIGSGDSKWYQNVGGTETEFELDEEYVYVNDLHVINGSEAVLEVGNDYDSFLLSYGVGRSVLTYQSEITDEYENLSFIWDDKGKDVLYYFADISRDGDAGDLIRYDGGKTTVAKEANGVIVLDDGAVFSLEDQRYNSSRVEYSFYSVGKDGKKTRIADDVSTYCIVDAKKVLYVSDGDLFVWDGKNSVRLARDVASIWCSKRADMTYFWCR